MNPEYDAFSQEELLLRRITEIHAQLVTLRQFPEYKRSLHQKAISEYLLEAEHAVELLLKRVHFCVVPDEDPFLESVRGLFQEADKRRYSIPRNLENN